jgi:hypothetical protein
MHKPDSAAVAAQLKAIQSIYAGWHSNADALAEAAALWRGGPNQYGVFTGGKHEEVARFGKVSTSMTIAEAPNGLFAADTLPRRGSAACPRCGASHMLSADSHVRRWS